MLSENDQLLRDEEMARQLQQEEIGAEHAFYENDNPDIVAPLLNNNDNAANEQNPNQARGLRRNVIESVSDVDNESPRILLGRVALALIEMIATTIVLSIGWNEGCGRPLKYWLLAFTGRHWVIVPLRVFLYRTRNSTDIERRAKAVQILRMTTFLTFLCFLIGQSFLFTGKSCQNTSPVIWYYCLAIIIIVYISLAIPFLIVLGICICLPCVLIVFRYFAEPEGANTEIIDNLPTRVFKLSPAGDKPKKKKQNEDDANAKLEDAHDSNDDNDNAQGCAVCIADFQEGDTLTTLPCGHEFHKDCVTKWLPIKKICPLCRHDITKKGKPRHAAANANNPPNANNNNARGAEGEDLEQA